MLPLVLSLLVIPLESLGEPIVTISDGELLGIEHYAADNSTYYGFHGIPYAKPPVGDLRFMSPQSPHPWTDTWNATYDRPGCISDFYFENSANEAEDCLYVNVYTPQLTSHKPLAVILWIYGGGFSWGNASYNFYGPHYFMEERNVIFVSAGYRLGPFGFLSTNDSTMPGNAGLKDILAILDWTHNNIANFSGDPNKITVFGESAGAAALGMLMTIKKAQGKFRAAILDSGSAFSSWSINHNATFMTYEILSNLSRADLVSDYEGIKTLLQNLTAEELLRAVPVRNALLQPLPVIEPETDEAVLTQYQYEVYENGNFAQVPVLLGTMSAEGIYILQNLAFATTYATTVDAQNSSLVPPDLFATGSDYSAIASAVKSIYLEDEDTFSNNIPALISYLSDFLIRKAVLKQAYFLALQNKVYVYQFSYYGQRLFVPEIAGPNKVSHIGELPYVMYMSPFVSTNETDLLIQRRMTKLFSNFANYLNPTPEETDLLSVSWPTYTVLNKQYLDINVELTIQSYKKVKTFDSWDAIYETYGKKPLTTY